MRTPLAWRNLIHNKTRTTVASAGMAFAVTLIFMQLGFLGAVAKTATLIYDALDFDLLIRSRSYLHLADPQVFPRQRLRQAASVPGVEVVHPFSIEINGWRNPHDGSIRSILTMGTRPHAPVFFSPEIRRKSALLTSPEAVLVDRKSRREFGPQNGRRFSDVDVGVVTEVANRRVQIVGHFGLGTGLAADGAILLGERGFLRIFPGRSADDTNLGLVELAASADRRGRPCADPQAIAVKLRQILPEDVEVLTRDEVIDRELRRWIRETSIGLIFRIGVVVALMVGTAIVYQVLSNDVAAHLPEYATLKAIGYSNRFLASVVLWQALALALLGFIPGLAISYGLYRLTSYLANIPIEMDLQRAAFVLAMSLVMCMVSGLLALRKVRLADPADLF